MVSKIMTNQQLDEKDLISTQTDRLSRDDMLDQEWLLTNKRGSYSSLSLMGCQTRRYHGLLVASMRPPVERYVTLANVNETIHSQGKRLDLGNFEFSDCIHPNGYKSLRQFRRHGGVTFTYELDDLSIDKHIYLASDEDLLVIKYQFTDITSPLQFKLQPMVAMRDFHALGNKYAKLSGRFQQQILTVSGHDDGGPALHMYSPDVNFSVSEDWWYDLHYRVEMRRGQDFKEDLWVPGCYDVKIDHDRSIIFYVQVTPKGAAPSLLNFNSEKIIAKINAYQDGLLSTAQVQDDLEKKLVLAADQFVVQRLVLIDGKEKLSYTILAGYPWFADWGRDTFIALPGCLLTTGRHDIAKDVLSTFSYAVLQGQVPNRFDDYGGAPHYNSIDASMWFINACWEYLQATDDIATFRHELLPKIKEIIKYYTTGTRDGIRADNDGLITGGSYETQLTWMDAKCQGVAFTPRYGKAVEINALWINALYIMVEATNDFKEKQGWLKRVQQVETNFNALFWNEERGCLYDCVYPDGTKDDAIRPNQIFAVSLGYSALDEIKQRKVVDIVQDHLLTPYGLRSLSPLHQDYKGHCIGDQFSRDSAYHQGTVWGWLIGPFIESYLKVNHYTVESKHEANDMIKYLVAHLQTDAGLGSISEIFDGNAPHMPRGCIAQAWSVASLLRIKKSLF
jgi:predicted glycogen debranching enzyme